MYRLLLFIAPVCLLLFAACRPETYTPKPRGYFRVSLPEHQYQAFNNPQFPYSFEYPTYASITRDTNLMSKPENPYWINMDFKQLGGVLNLTYKEIRPGQTIEKLIEDAHKMSYFHDVRADYIADHEFHTENHVSGIFYNVGGNAATNYEFYATDSTHHFIWGALYFDVTPNADSLHPVTEFIKKDMDHFLETLRWK